MPQPSYVHGAGATSLIGATIGEYFDHIAERYAEHDALIVRHQHVRWTWRELKQRVDDLPRGSWHSASNAASASGSGRPTMPNGSSANLPPRKPG